MNILDSSLWRKSLDEVIATTPLLNLLADTTIMITGTTGLICSALTDLLIRWNECHRNKIQIIAAGRSKQRVDERFAPYSGEKWFHFLTYDALSTNNELTQHCDYIIHGASNAFPQVISSEPVETMLSNFLGVKYLLDYAFKIGAKRLLYISSSEVYGQKSSEDPFGEIDYGFVDLLNPRNAYSVGKRAAETLCASYAVEYGVESVIVRPGHIYGPTATKQDTRVSSQWAYAAAQGQNIVMKSEGAQKRSYCYCLDCASAILTVLLKGQSGQAYNISNRDSVITIRQMAQILADLADVSVETKVPTEMERDRFNPMNNSSLDSTKLEKLGWKGLLNAERGFAQTVEVLKELME